MNGRARSTWQWVVWAAGHYLTSCVVFVAVWIGVFVAPSVRAPRSYLGGFVQIDGISHEELVTRGYADAPRTAARFPAYIVLSWAVERLTGASAALALVLTANACFLAALIVLAKYLAERRRVEGGVAGPPQRVDLTLLALGLWPFSLFFRMAYTESLFLLCAIVSMYAIERRWPAWAIALVVGLTTATRPVGVALVAVFAMHLWQESRRNALRSPARSLRSFVPRAALWLPLSCWGLIAYMAYLHLQFGDAFAFAHAQDMWVRRATYWPEKIVPLVALEPLWSPYVHGATTYWRSYDSGNNPLLSFGFVNPIVFVLTVAAVVTGAIKKWLNGRELLLCGLLLGIPYVTMAYDNIMLGQARFASVVFPAYIVLGRLLRRLPPWAIAVFFVLCALLLGFYSALFAGGYGQTCRVLY
ncbi:MAG: hypothetical protein HYS13_25485 [Planctomycetia bacterium]|nr:hypothetical protein [Planctomycetia bacterium]